MNEKKRRRRPFDDPFGFFDEEYLRLSEMMDRLLNQALKDKEDQEPFVYGFSVRTGPDGKPVFSRFGDAVSPGEDEEEGITRQPLTDIIERHDSVSVTIEMPGVEKEDIELDIEGKKMTVKVDAPHRRYHKVIDLPCRVDDESVKATFRNGVLDVSLIKTEESKSRKITIE